MRENINWKYVKALKSANLINEFETLVCYELPKEFKECVLQYNGGRPERKGFDTDKNKGRELKSFLSFNKEDRETVWKTYEWNKEELADRYLAFAIDNFGNLICFDVRNGNVIFLNHENLSTEHIAETFTEFLELLY